MTPDQRRKFNTAFGGLFLGIGIVSWMFSTYFVVVPRAPVPPAIIATSVDLPSCQIALTELGYTATERAGEITAFEPLSPFPKEQLEKASIASSLCHISMHSFCMGESCEPPGLTLVLRAPVERAVDKEAIAPTGDPKTSAPRAYSPGKRPTP